MAASMAYRIQFQIGALQYEKLQKLKNKKGFPVDKSVDLFAKQELLKLIE
jgi:hypothetical protein